VTTGFDANVPARKPRTISRVLTELTAVSESSPDPSSVPSSPPGPLSVPERGNERTAAIELAAEPPAPKPGPRVSRGSNGKERTASLRERLALTAHAAGAEPQQTAARVRELIEGMRARLEAAIEERTKLAGELEEARAALSRSEAELKKERRARTALETQAEERRRIAEEAVAEAEALAAERDQVLEEIAGLRGLEEQAALLQEAEAELADLDGRLKEAQSARARAEVRCRELTAEVERLSAAGEALEGLEALVKRSR
jgi:SWI/SNF-related matrix-associated actin-dependent regulator 1 of chromatin subfamily A